MLQIKFKKISLTYFGYFFHKNNLNHLFETLRFPTVRVGVYYRNAARSMPANVEI